MRLQTEYWLRAIPDQDNRPATKLLTIDECSEIIFFCKKFGVPFRMTIWF